MPDVVDPPPKSSSSAVARFATAFTSARRSLRNFLTQDRVSDTIKTLAWVVPLTLLIWVYAEREQLAKESGVPIPILLTSADPTRVVTMLRPIEPVVLADLEGPRSELDAVRNEFVRVGGGVEAVEIYVNAVTEGTQELRTAAELNKNPLFAQRGIIVGNCQPPVIQISIDRYVEKDIPIVLPATVTELVSQPVFEPSHVRVRVPENVLKEAEKLGPPQAYAEIVGVPELRTPGTHVLSNVRVRVVGLQAEHLTVSPAAVKATLEVRQADERYTIPFMAVKALSPTAFQRQYEVDCPETIANVTVIGPANKIALLKQESPEVERPYAVLDVSFEDRPTTGQTVSPSRTRRLNYVLPEGMRVAAEDAQRTIDFKIVEHGAEN